MLRLNDPVNNFSVMWGRSQRFLGVTSNQYCRELMCLAQGHNTMTHVIIEPRTSRFGVRRCTITPPRSLFVDCTWATTIVLLRGCNWFSMHVKNDRDIVESHGTSRRYIADDMTLVPCDCYATKCGENTAVRK